MAAPDDLRRDPRIVAPARFFEGDECNNDPTDCGLRISPA